MVTVNLIYLFDISMSPFTQINPLLSFLFIENLKIPDVTFSSKKLLKKKRADDEDIDSDRLSISASTYSLYDRQDGGATNEGTEVDHLLQEHDELTEAKRGAANEGGIIHEEKSETGTVRFILNSIYLFFLPSLF